MFRKGQGRSFDQHKGGMTDKRDKYIQGKLNKEDKHAHEVDLTSSEREELSFELGVQHALKEKFSEELRAKVSGFEAKQPKARKTPIYIGIAASLALLATFLFINNRGEASLFDQYYEVYPNYEYSIVRGENGDDIKSRAYEAYDARDFDTASSLFSQWLSENPEDIPARFFGAIANVEQGSMELALEDLKIVIESGNADYRDPATWYAALVHTQLGNKVEATTLIKQLSDLSDFSDKSEKLLKELN